MTDKQWSELKKVINGEILSPLPAGFIIDSPWLPNWYGISIVDYFSSDDLWMKANMKAIDTFPDVWFLPGFWSEYGMCSEPSAFGAKVAFPVNEFPHAYPNLKSPEQIDELQKPHVVRDGLAPFMLNRLRINQPVMEDKGHRIRFSVSRGPLNIASYLMGTTEFMMALMTHPQQVQKLLRLITDYLKEFHDLQRDWFHSIDGILVLDDIIGFISRDQFVEFGLPYFKEIFDRDLSVKFLHNDANCMESVVYLPEIGVNLFNMGFDTDLNQLKELTDNKVTMLGNLPPRDVLAKAPPGEVGSAVKSMITSLLDPSRIILSCGGGMPPEVSTENIRAFVEAIPDQGN
jgi:uroporphyrinogen decarboxylase